MCPKKECVPKKWNKMNILFFSAAKDNGYFKRQLQIGDSLLNWKTLPWIIKNFSEEEIITINKWDLIKGQDRP